MKRSFYLLLSLVAVAIFSTSSISLAGSHDKDKPKPAAAAEPKVTKKDAEQVVRFAYPGCIIEEAKVVNGKDHLNWAVSVVPRGASTETQIVVDGINGKILTVPDAGAVRTGKM
jgi:hypothetical protein